MAFELPTIGTGRLPAHNGPLPREGARADAAASDTQPPHVAAAARAWQPPSLDQIVRGSLGAFTGATLAISAPITLGITAVGSGAATLASGVQLALSGIQLGRRDYPVAGPDAYVTQVAVASMACVASTLGAGLTTLALPLSVPAATLGGAWFNGAAPFCLGYLLMGATAERLGMNNPNKAKKTARAATAAQIPAPAQVQEVPKRSPAGGEASYAALPAARAVPVPAKAVPRAALPSASDLPSKI